MKDMEIMELLSSSNIIDQVFEQIRLVDPTRAKVISYKKDDLYILENQCYDFWNRNKMCDNCISMRAYNEGHSYVKVEYTSDKLYMITAAPIEINGKKVVVELLKDVTDSLIFAADSSDDGINSEIRIIIDNLNRVAMRDGLTGLFNRRYMNEKLPADLTSAALAGQDLSVILIDIDYFKKVNDTYGHPAGDYALKVFAETLTGCVNRESDWIARYGGEEFLVCLPGAKLDKTLEIAEMMRKAVEEMEIRHGDHTFKITACFGVSSCKPQLEDKVDQIIQTADRNLYIAKRNGRNRVNPGPLSGI